MDKKLVSLGNQDDPVVVIGEEKGEVEGKAWVKDNKVVVNEDSGHILCDLAGTQVWSQGKLHLDPT